MSLLSLLFPKPLITFVASLSSYSETFPGCSSNSLCEALPDYSIQKWSAFLLNASSTYNLSYSFTCILS